MNEVHIDIDSIKERLGDLEVQLIMKNNKITELQNKINELENAKK